MPVIIERRLIEIVKDWCDRMTNGEYRATDLDAVWLARKYKGRQFQSGDIVLETSQRKIMRLDDSRTPFRWRSPPAGSGFAYSRVLSKSKHRWCGGRIAKCALMYSEDMFERCTRKAKAGGAITVREHTFLPLDQSKTDGVFCDICKTRRRLLAV